MKTLTVISVTLMPLTLVSSTFGMNYIIPFQKNLGDFLCDLINDIIYSINSKYI